MTMRIASFVCVLLMISANAMAQNRPRDDRRGGKQPYSIEQAISDQAQLHTIAFNGLAFVTGDYGASTFLPPGKVCDYFGFQYMRDIDAAGKGHNPVFLNRVAGNVLYILSDSQREQLASLAKEQAPQFDDLARMRWPIIKSFCRALAGDVPQGSAGLNQESVAQAVGELFAKDAELAYRRAILFGQIVASLTQQQKDYLGKMKFGDFNTWPDVDSSDHRLPRGTEKMVNVLYMTYASEFFSWYAGSVEADTYFCPERHGTYFGGFYMKDMPAMGKRDYNISTSVTGDSGRSFIELLSPEQRSGLVAIPNQQRQQMSQIVDIRRQISTELRKLLAGKADHDKIIALGRHYGELDGQISWLYASTFAKIGLSMTDNQRQQAMKLRNLDGYTSAPAYIYSAAVRESPSIGNTDHFFFAPRKTDRSGK